MKLLKYKEYFRSRCDIIDRGDFVEIKECAKELIILDCKDMMETLFSMKQDDQSIFMLAAMPYLCLIVNEAYRWCSKAGICLNKFESKSVLENIRSKGKLFGNDKFLNFDKQAENIDNIVKVEHLYYKRKSYLPDFMRNDVGTYWIDNMCIGNTIQYAYDFSLFAPENKSLYESQKEVYEFSVEIGSAYQEIISTLTGFSYSIKATGNKIKHHSYLDFKYKRDYKNVDNVIIHSLICRINFLLYFLKKFCRKESMMYLRMIYITFYSMKNDMEALGINSNRCFDDYYEKEFRNAMAHYSLYGKINNKELLTNSVGFGLIEKYFSCDYGFLVEIIEKKLSTIVFLLENSFNLDVKKGYNANE